MYCSNCGTRLGDQAVFCSNCGTRVLAPALDASNGAPPEPSPDAREAAPVPAPPDSPGQAQDALAASPPGAPGGASARRLLIAAALACAGIVVGYLYWTGYVGNRHETVAGEIRSTLAANRFTGVEVSVSRQWVATLSGVVESESRRRQLLTVLQRHDDIRAVESEGLRVRPEPDEVAKSLMAELDSAGPGLGALKVDVMPDYSATVSGAVASDQDAEKVRELIQKSGWIARAQFDLTVSAAGAAASVPASPETRTASTAEPAPQNAGAVAAAPTRESGASPAAAVPASSKAAVETVNGALRQAGVSGISAGAGPGQAVVLKGAVSSRAAKEAALELARRAAPGFAVRDQVFVVD